MLTNRPRSFHNTSLIEIKLSHCRKIIVSVFRDFFKRLLAKVIEYRNYITFNQNKFLGNFDQEYIKGNAYNDEQQYYTFTSVFRKVLDEHALLKTKKLRENQATFMTRGLRKTIMDQSMFKNKCLNWALRVTSF